MLSVSARTTWSTTLIKKYIFETGSCYVAMALQLASCLRLPTAGMTSVSYRACLKAKCSPSSQDPMQCVLVKACSPNLFFLLSHTALLWVPGTCCSFRWGHPSCRSPKALTHPARLLLPGGSSWEFVSARRPLLPVPSRPHTTHNV